MLYWHKLGMLACPRQSPPSSRYTSTGLPNALCPSGRSDDVSKGECPHSPGCAADCGRSRCIRLAGPGIAQTRCAKGLMDPTSQGPVSQQALDVDIPHTCQVVPSCFEALPEHNGSDHTRGTRRAMPATNAVEEHILTSPQRVAQERKQVAPLLVSPIRVGDSELAQGRSLQANATSLRRLLKHACHLKSDGWKG